MASPLTVLGFEQGTTAGMATGVNLAKYVDRTVGTLGTQVEIVSAAARTGTYGLRLTSSAATVHIGWQNSGAGGLLGTASTLVGSFWFRFPTLPSNDYNIFIGIGTAGGNDFILKYLNSTTGLQATLGGSTQLGPNISANTWYQVDFSLVLNANPHTLDWRIDGVAQTSLSLSAASESLFVAGFGQDNANSTGTLHVDDVVMSVTTADYPLGKHKVVGLKPDTGGTTAEIGTANATARFVSNGITLDATHNSANILAALSELPPTLGGSASGVYQRTSGATNAVGIPMTTYTLAGGETLSGLRVLVCGWSSTSTANNIGLRTFNGTTETTLFTAADPNFDNSTTVPGWLCKMATVADFDTQTELDALVIRYGYSTDVSPVPGAHAIYAEVAVKESTGVTGTAAPVETADTSSASGILGYSGTVAASQAAQTSSASGTVSGPVSGTVAVTQAAQTATAAGILGYSGTTAVTQAGQTSSATGVLGYSGTAAVTQANQTSTASGTFTPAGFSGSVTVTQANQTSTASGALGYSGSSARTQANQTSTASGTFTAAGVSGAVAATQAAQTSTAVGVLGYSGTSARTQAGNVAAASGTVANPVTGTVAIVQSAQFATATAMFQPLILAGTAHAATGPVPTALAAIGAAAAASSSATPVAAAAGGSMTVPTATGA